MPLQMFPESPLKTTEQATHPSSKNKSTCVPDSEACAGMQNDSSSYVEHDLSIGKILRANTIQELACQKVTQLVDE